MGVPAVDLLTPPPEDADCANCGKATLFRWMRATGRARILRAVWASPKSGSASGFELSAWIDGAALHCAVAAGLEGISACASALRRIRRGSARRQGGCGKSGRSYRSAPRRSGQVLGPRELAAALS